MKILILACCLTPACHGLRRDSARPPSTRPAPRVTPARGERHIQWIRGNRRGIGDRSHVIAFLLRLGELHDATVHMEGGELGGRRHLSHAHSSEISANWSKYFDPVGSCGRSPFHEVENFEGCKVLSQPNVSLARLFDDGSLCVNIENTNVYKFTRQALPEGPDCYLKPSAEVRAASAQFFARYGIPELRFGSYHIRRCDRMWSNSECTRPEVVRADVEAFPEVGVWVFFTYAEAGYTETLRQALAPLAGSRRLLFEDDVVLNPLEDGDNYFAMMVLKGINQRAGVSVDTHVCKKHRPQIATRTSEMLRKADHFAEDLGTCGGSAGGSRGPEVDRAGACGEGLDCT